MNEDFNVVMQDLPTTIGGFTKETDGYYTIVLNSRMTHERNQQSYIHEKGHIDSMDFDRERNIDQIEKKADERRNTNGKEKESDTWADI